MQQPAAINLDQPEFPLGIHMFFHQTFLPSHATICDPTPVRVNNIFGDQPQFNWQPEVDADFTCGLSNWQPEKEHVHDICLERRTPTSMTFTCI